MRYSAFHQKPEAVFCFWSERIIPEEPEYKKYQHYVQGEVLSTPKFDLIFVF